MLGCMGMYGSIKSIIYNTAKAKEISPDLLTGEIVFEMANNGNKEVTQAITTYCHSLAQLITNIYLIYDPQIFCIGGGISSQTILYDILNKEIDKMFSTYSLTFIRPKVINCQFYNDANLTGALYHHLNILK